MPSPFKGMGNTAPRRDSEFIRPGRYVCRIDKFSFGKTRKDRGYALWNLRIVDVLDDTEGAKVPEGSNRVADKISWMLMADNDASAPSLKAAMMTATGSSSEELDDDAFDLLAGTSQPLAGTFVEVDAKQITTKAGAPFTLVTFKRSYSEEEIKAIVPDEARKSLKLGF